MIIGASVALLLASTAALAFQEQQVGGDAAAAQAPVPAESAPAAQPGAVEFAVPESTLKSLEGIEVRIPGLGHLGVLPKVDFGLELLYGATDSKQPEATPEDPAEDLRIRGTLKHNF